MRIGVRLGIDVGTVRIGVARSDADGLLATPLETVPRGAGDLEAVAALIVDLAVVEVIVGLPLALSGRETSSTADARRFAEAVARRRLAPVRVVDERLSTVSATAQLRSAGRTAKNSRSVIDQVAAVIILQHALDCERSAASAPGALIDPHEGT